MALSRCCRTRDLLGRPAAGESLGALLQGSYLPYTVVEDPERKTVAVKAHTGEVYSAEVLVVRPTLLNTTWQCWPAGRRCMQRQSTCRGAIYTHMKGFRSCTALPPMNAKTAEPDAVPASTKATRRGRRPAGVARVQRRAGSHFQQEGVQTLGGNGAHSRSLTGGVDSRRRASCTMRRRSRQPPASARRW